MQIESKKDLALIRRAQREGWSYDRGKVVAALMEIVEARDPDLVISAVERLQAGDALDIKREEAAIKRELLELKKVGDENTIRLRLLELARHCEPAELAKLASKNGLDVGAIGGDSGD